MTSISLSSSGDSGNDRNSSSNSNNNSSNNNNDDKTTKNELSHPYPQLKSNTYDTDDLSFDLDLDQTEPLHKNMEFDIETPKTNDNSSIHEVTITAASPPSLPPLSLSSKSKQSQSRSCRSYFSFAIEMLKYIYSFLLLGFCITMVMGCIFTRQSSAADYGIHPVGTFFLFWFLVFWLALIEGGQGCIVGLQPVKRDSYAKTHQVTHMITEVAHSGDNMERFIVGRQFLVVLLIFLINICGSASKGADSLGLPSIWNTIFLDNGVAMIITTIVIGQLTSQVNAAVALLDFIDNYFMLGTVHLSLYIEMSGLLHCVYIVQIVFASMSRTQMESNESPRTLLLKVFFWCRIFLSIILLGFCLAVTLQTLFDGNSGMWEGVPTWASVIIFITLLFLAGLLDGMQIAAYALMNVPEEELRDHSVAYTNCQLMFQGRNLQSFLIGRQVFVASLIFIVARIASISGPGDYRIFGASAALQGFYNTGLLGSVVLTIVGSLIFRIIASSYPLAFMSNPIIYAIIRMCLLVERSGLCSSSWGLARVNKYMMGYQPDEVYLEDDASEADINCY